MAYSEISIPLEVLDEFKKRMKKIAPQKKKMFSRREAVFYLADTIKDLLTKNYSLSEISSMLQKEGVKISAATLKTYLREMEKERVSRKVICCTDNMRQIANENEASTPEQRTIENNNEAFVVGDKTAQKKVRDVSFGIEDDEI